MIFCPKKTYSFNFTFDIEKYYTKWGEPVSVRVKVKNPHNFIAKGKIIVSFTPSLVTYSGGNAFTVYYEGDKFLKTSFKGSVKAENKNIIVEKIYEKWGIGQIKVLDIKVLPLKIGHIGINARAIFVDKRNKSKLSWGQGVFC